MTDQESHDLDVMRARVGRVPFEVTTLAEAAEKVLNAGINHTAIPVRLSNAYCVALASNNPQYAALLNRDGWNFPDGTPVVWFIKRHRRFTNAQRVRGPSLFRLALDLGRRGNVRHFFLGTTDNTLTALTRRVEQDYPGICISGTYAPPFGDVDEKLISTCAEQILSSDAQIAWVALGTPKQDFLAAELAERTGRPCVAVGAAFDFVAGTAPEAPPWLQNSGFEWTYRLLKEPKRLWRRYLFGNVKFICVALKGDRA
ncbi:WecB/TagA/CpsF family glycosyltransferase [Rhodococcus ruber]|uniref:WecB/TagA/CpsF family glycosyltransferase n=1 Tax=Rhodococcus ruber TaxID=1830 RepID=UPI000F52E1E8|nr:WecB/TagA/CpsF family glycosyltransferase [Rhodococcus ruber]RQM32215.1 N-acetylglucosaminyldiphospho-UDP N-acetyl-beta-D-mannosaminyltransferase [Rhodococcus ruber]